MAKISGRGRMVDSINELTGEKCSEAAMIQQRPVWTLPVFFVAFMIVYGIALAIELHPIIGAGLAGGAGGASFAFTTKIWILARVGGDVVLSQSSKLWARAIGVEWREPVPVDARWAGGLINQKLLLKGEAYQVSRAFVSRINTILN